MKIAIVHIPLIRPGGATRQMLCMALQLKRMGHDITIYSPLVDPVNCYPQVLKKFKVFEVGLFRKPRIVEIGKPSSSRWANPSAIYRAFTFAKSVAPAFIINTLQAYMESLTYLYIGTRISKEFEIVNGHNFNSEWALYTSKMLTSKKTVWTCNEPPFYHHMPESLGIIEKILQWPLYGFFEKIAVKTVDHIIVLNTDVASDIRKIYSNNSVTVAYPGSKIPDEFYLGGASPRSANDIRRKYGLDGKFVILCVAALVNYKRPADALHALSWILPAHPNAVLLMVGDGPAKKSIVSLAKTLGISNNVLFLGGWLSDGELRALYEVCNVFIAPGEQTWGLSIIEAMSAGKSVITNRKAGVLEVLKPGRDCIAISPGDIEKLADAIDQLSKDERIRLSFGNSARQAVKKLTWEKYSAQVLSVFKELSGNERGATKGVKP